ncbi:MAG TPA: hydroxylamine reductase, partial [Magnetospirillaceae bacterium]|nr:hydroxylamine reductase [Magnetospirillaceae bacterium]
MFCFQCQETMGNKGCAAARGVCGKDAETAGLQDLLIHTLKGVSAWTVEARRLGIPTGQADDAVMDGLFSTVTNANFDPARFASAVSAALSLRDSFRDQVGLAARPIREPDSSGKSGPFSSDAALWTSDPAGYAAKAGSVGVLSTEDEDIRSLRQLVIYGLKGMSAYAHHAAALGRRDPEVFAFLHRALAATLDDSLSAEALTALVLDCGAAGVKAMALLDAANTGTYGKPEITEVNIGVRGNPGILVSGHDLGDLEMLLKQTEGTGLDVYTHSEMLPAHCYPAFRGHPRLAGNYGNAWWKQREEFEKFNGAILMTSNCIVPPADSYRDRLFTTGTAGFPGCVHIESNAQGRKDFSAVIAAARGRPAPEAIESGCILAGFAHDQAAALARDIVGAIKSGKIRRFIVMAGCDGRFRTREYYTDFARALPKDTVILTAGCAKYRYNKLGLGEIDGIPRVLDAGQCNDSYSLAVTALALKDAFGLKDVNDLPISFNVAWYEQKAVLVLLALLSLGFRKIHLGPTLPAF